MDKNPVEPEELFSPFDRALGSIHARLFGRGRAPTLMASVALYVIGVLCFGPRLGVSTNFFVMIPVISAALGYGLAAGIAAGTLALPGNLALYAILGHPEFSPASKILAELSGIVLGTVVGYLSDYYRRLEAEHARRRETEKALRNSLMDREALFREVHHRVKNNLNLIKSIVCLQARRSNDRNHKEFAAALSGRIMSISFVHERLYRTPHLSSIDLREYLGDLAAAIAISGRYTKAPPSIVFDIESPEVSIDTAVSLGLIVNELVSNSVRHGPSTDHPLHVELSVRVVDNEMTLVERDDGVGLPGLEEGVSVRGDDMAAANTEHLGMTLLELMAIQLGGEGRYAKRGQWTEYSISFPFEAPALS